ncbi:MAG: hypothetical protein Q7S43_00515 [bacterium]|nr:hypothetical protein [bacterium]
MLKETPPSEILDLKTLSPQTKMRTILEAFDAGTGSKQEREDRKQKFIKLIGRYNQAIIKSRPSQSEKELTYSDESKKKLHDEIMSAMRSISLSQIDPTIRELAEYLVHDRQEVERMVTSYFLGYDTTPNPKTYSPIKKARENPLYFSKPGEDD